MQCEKTWEGIHALISYKKKSNKAVSRSYPDNKTTTDSPAANDQNCSFFDKSMKLCQITHIPVTNIFRYGASLNKLP